MSSERKLMSWTARVLVAAGVLLSAVYLSADSETAADLSRRRPSKRVEVATVATAQAARQVRFSGVLRSVRRARLGFTRGGRVVSRPVQVGDRVRRGQVLARRDAVEFDNAVAAARAQLAEFAARRAQGEREAERARRLVAAKAATGEELERSTAALDALRAAEQAATARLREAQRRRDEVVLRAPFDGTITEVFFEADEFAAAGRPVVVLSGDGPIEVEVELPESLIIKVARGDAVQVDLPALGITGVPGQVTSVAHMAIGQGRLFPVVAAIEVPPQVVSGMTAEVLIEVSSNDTLAVPVEAVVNPGGRQPAVFRLRGETVEKVVIEVDGLVGELVIVRGALRAGDRVVVGGQRGLLDGERVEVAP